MRLTRHPEICCAFNRDENEPVTEERIKQVWKRLKKKLETVLTLEKGKDPLHKRLRVKEVDYSSWTSTKNHLFNPLRVSQALYYDDKIRQLIKDMKDETDKKALTIWAIGRNRRMTQEEMAKCFGVSRPKFNKRINRLKKMYGLEG